MFHLYRGMIDIINITSKTHSDRGTTVTRALLWYYGGVISDRNIDFQPNADQIVSNCRYRKTNSSEAHLNLVKHVVSIAVLKRLITAFVCPVLHGCFRYTHQGTGSPRSKALTLPRAVVAV